MSWVDSIKEALPEYAKDTKLNLDSVINRSSIPVDEAHGIALAAAMSSGNGKLVTFIASDFLDEKLQRNYVNFRKPKFCFSFYIYFINIHFNIIFIR